MANDIFGKNVKIGAGPLGRAETFEVRIADSGFIGLAQGVQNSYSQPLQRVYELGSFTTYMVSGRALGNLNITRLVGKDSSKNPATLVEILKRASAGTSALEVDGSRGATVTLTEKTTGYQWILSGCYVSTENTQTDSNGILVSENIVIEYQKMETKQRTII